MGVCADDVNIGAYTVGQYLGNGAYGVVRCAYHSETGEKVAIKDIRKEKVKDLEAVERIDNEIK